MLVLNDVFHPHDPFSIKVDVFDVLVQECFNDVLSCLKTIIFDEVVNYELIQVEKMSALGKSYA